jgi:glutathione S-transferase
MAALPILWHIEVSHYNEKARWALDYKGVAHERRVPMPGLHGLRALVLTRGKQRRLPVLQLNGSRIGDSTAIVAALEEYRPEPALYPEEDDDRRRALELEDYFDEELGPRLRRLVWHYTLHDQDAVIDAVMPNAGAGRVRMMRAIAPVARPLVRRDYGVTEAGAAEALTGIRAAMDRLESELQPNGYLVGDRFSVADLTAAAMLTPVLAPPERPYAPNKVLPPVLEVREELEGRAGGAWVAEMYARHRGVSAEVVGRG